MLKIRKFSKINKIYPKHSKINKKAGRSCVCPTISAE